MHYIYTLFFLILLFNEVKSSGFYRISNPRECDGIHPNKLKTTKSVPFSFLRTITQKDEGVEEIRFSTLMDESKEKNTHDGEQSCVYGTQVQDHDTIVDKEKGLISDSFNQDSDLLKGKFDEFSLTYLNIETVAIGNSDHKKDESEYQ